MACGRAVDFLWSAPAHPGEWRRLPAVGGSRPWRSAAVEVSWGAANSGWCRAFSAVHCGRGMRVAFIGLRAWCDVSAVGRRRRSGAWHRSGRGRVRERAHRSGGRGLMRGRCNTSGVSGDGRRAGALLLRGELRAAGVAGAGCAAAVGASPRHCVPPAASESTAGNVRLTDAIRGCRLGHARNVCTVGITVAAPG
jgi:hypothetical protein